MKLIRDDDDTAELIKRIDKMRGTKMKFGILGSGEGGQKHKDSDITVVHIANIHEFGWPDSGIPERSFMRKTFDDKQKDIADVVEMHIESYVFGDVSFKGATDAIGEYVVGLIQNTLNELSSPPLKQATIDAKGSSSPLINKGQLLDSIEFEVV